MQGLGVSTSEGITSILGNLEQEISGEEVGLGEVVEKLEGRGFGPMLMVPAFIALMPTGAIPGVPSACGILIFLIAIQLIFGKESPWLPSFLRNISFERERFQKAIEKAEPVTQKLDGWFHLRLEVLTSDPVKWLLAAACALFGLLMIPLEVVPLAAALPALAILLTSIGFIFDDGLVIAIACVVFAGSCYLAITQLLVS